MLWMSKKEMQADLLSKVILLPKPSCRKPSYGSISKTSTCNSRPSRFYEFLVHHALCFLVYYFHWILTTVIQMLLFSASQGVNWGLGGSNWLPQDCQQQGRVPAGSLDLFPANDTVYLHLVPKPGRERWRVSTPAPPWHCGGRSSCAHRRRFSPELKGRPRSG